MNTMLECGQSETILPPPPEDEATDLHGQDKSGFEAPSSAIVGTGMDLDQWDHVGNINRHG